jgi:hypothetical protein
MLLFGRTSSITCWSWNSWSKPESDPDDLNYQSFCGSSSAIPPLLAICSRSDRSTKVVVGISVKFTLKVKDILPTETPQCSIRNDYGNSTQCTLKYKYYCIRFALCSFMHWFMYRSYAVSSKLIFVLPLLSVLFHTVSSSREALSSQTAHQVDHRIKLVDRSIHVNDCLLIVAFHRRRGPSTT